MGAIDKYSAPPKRPESVEVGMFVGVKFPTRGKQPWYGRMEIKEIANGYFFAEMDLGGGFKAEGTGAVCDIWESPTGDLYLDEAYGKELDTQ